MSERIAICAEIAQMHDGSIGIAHSMVDALAKTGVDIVKFQTHIADAESSEWEKFRIPFSYEDKSRYDYWRRMEFTYNQWKTLKEHVEDLGMQFLSTPFSIEAIELLEHLGVSAYKIGSGEVNCNFFVERVAKCKKPVIISSGMSNNQQVKAAIKALETGTTDITVCQCTSLYPTPLNRVNLSQMQLYSKEYNVKPGYSCHTGEIYPSIAAAVLGAKYLEFHVTFDKQMFGPDSTSSLDMNQVKELVKGVRSVEKIVADSNIEESSRSDIIHNNKIFSRSLSAKTAISKGQTITIDMLEIKRPADKGLSIENAKKIVGIKALKNIEKGESINKNLLEENSEILS